MPVGLTLFEIWTYLTITHSVVLDLHQKLDGLEEAELGGGKIGTTGKGNIILDLYRRLLLLIIYRNWSLLLNKNGEKWC